MKKLHLLKGSGDKKKEWDIIHAVLSHFFDTRIHIKIHAHTLTHMHIHTGAYIMCNGFVYLFIFLPFVFIFCCLMVSFFFCFLKFRTYTISECVYRSSIKARKCKLTGLDVWMRRHFHRVF